MKTCLRHRALSADAYPHEFLRLIACLFCVAIFSPLVAQDYTHPRNMALPASAFERPDPLAHQVRLNNGLVGYIVEDHIVPMVTLTAYINAGSADAAKTGAAEALAYVLQNKGASSMYAGGFRITLENMAAEYSVNLTAELLEIRLNVPAEDTWGALLLLAQALKEPDIGADTIISLRNRAARARNRPGADSGYEGSLDEAVQRFKSHLFSGHPYGRKPSATDFGALAVEDVRAYQQSYLTPRNTVIAISGDFSAGDVRLAFEQSFQDWVSAPKPKRPVIAAIDTATQRRVYAYDVDKLQAWLVLGHELPVVPLEDQASLEVMNYILGGGHFDTRLFRETRDKRGLTNDDSGFPEANWRGPGSYTFQTYGRPEVVHLLAELTLKEIKRIRTEPVSDEELFVAKNALADGVFEMQFQNGHTIAQTFAKEWLRYGNHAASASYRDRIRAVTAEMVRASAQKYLHPDRMQLVVLGPQSKIENAEYPEGGLRLQDFGEYVQAQ